MIRFSNVGGATLRLSLACRFVPIPVFNVFHLESLEWLYCPEQQTTPDRCRCLSLAQQVGDVDQESAKSCRL